MWPAVAVGVCTHHREVIYYQEASRRPGRRRPNANGPARPALWESAGTPWSMPVVCPSRVQLGSNGGALMRNELSAFFLPRLTPSN